MTFEIVVNDPAENNENPKKAVFAECPEGSVVVGGGGAILPVSVEDIALVTSVPDDNGWLVRAEEIQPQQDDWRLTSHAICAVSAPLP